MHDSHYMVTKQVLINTFCFVSKHGFMLLPLKSTEVCIIKALDS